MRTHELRKKELIDDIRASHDGNEFNETWAARKSLQLLNPDDNLVGIAIEGLSPIDRSKATTETVEIADVTLYYGKGSSFEIADKIEIKQLKYSISSKDYEFRVSHAKKTIEKFAKAYLDYGKKYDAKNLQNKLSFELITNRPIYKPFEQAIKLIATSRLLDGEIKKQADQFQAASKLQGIQLIEFAKMCIVTGLAGNLEDLKRDLSRTLIDWSATYDAIAEARLGKLKKIVRDKAGGVGVNRNVIRYVDVLNALGVAEKRDLLPCPSSLPKIGPRVERKQLKVASEIVPKLDKPFLIHAEAGTGKTVFMESLADILATNHEVVFFDCFGGGAYRAPEDARHLPKKGLIHIVNTLAFRGLCDPLLPDNDNTDSLINAFRRRLTQCVKTLSLASKGRELILFIDAIDNAAIEADDRGQESFPTLLLQSLQYTGPITGVKVVVSCRSHRILPSAKDIEYEGFKLTTFDLSETTEYLQKRLKNVTEAEIQVAQARSKGNPRILEYIATSDRELLNISETDKEIKLDELLNSRIEKALSEARKRGSKAEDIESFLAGLSSLPPPVPIDEYAHIQGLEISAIESFAVDLFPLIDSTKHGMIFRDEPTETLIREQFESNNNALKRVADSLQTNQAQSVYAASALPGLLQKLNEGVLLFELAFDQTFPEAITSTVGKRNIRYARLKAAVYYAASKKDFNHLVELLAELSTVTAVEQKGSDYILSFPDLVIAAEDVDATRRLFEIRTAWPGTRHARLAIANTLSQDLSEAFIQASTTLEWIYHYYQQDKHTMNQNESRPSYMDIAAVPFSFITLNRSKNAINFLNQWKHWYAYELGESLFNLLDCQKYISPSVQYDLDSFLNLLTREIGIITSALSFLELNRTQKMKLTEKLSKVFDEKADLELPDRFTRLTEDTIQVGLLKSSTIAASLGQVSEGLKIAESTPYERPSIWNFESPFSDKYISSFMIHAALVSGLSKKTLRVYDLLPNELYAIVSGIKSIGDINEFKTKLKEKLESRFQSKRNKSKKAKNYISYDLKRDADRFVDYQLEPLLALTKALSTLLCSNSRNFNKAFLAFLDTWTDCRKKGDIYERRQFDRFFQLLGCKLAVFALCSRNELNYTSAKIFLKKLQDHEIFDVTTLTVVVSIFSKKAHLHSLAGEEAIKVSSLIKKESEVSTRASMYGQLAKAILQANKEDAITYFKLGLEQMDAIGSGDHQFTNELLLFAASLKGDELPDQDSHALTNICELNMTDESDKFPWSAFANGLSKTAGMKILAKLARWDDRAKVSLTYTLLPYLTALVQDRKIEPELAITLNNLADPVEYMHEYGYNTSGFAKAIDDNSYSNSKNLIQEVIRQFVANNPGISSKNTIEILAFIAEKELWGNLQITTYLSLAKERFPKIQDELNDQMNYRGKSSTQFFSKQIKKEMKSTDKFDQLVKKCIPTDESSIIKTLDELNKTDRSFELKEKLFKSLLRKVPVSDRGKYIHILASLENLDIYTKLRELKKCKIEWGKSFISLKETFEKIGKQLVQLHSKDFISYDYFSGSRLNEISELTGISITTLSLELIKVFASTNAYTSASAWLGLASIINEKADRGRGQNALERLLNGNATQLASTVKDGAWNKNLYPDNNSTEITSGFIWKMLGSPRAADRWRAMHSMRTLANFGKWNVINAIAAKFSKENANPFQAPELPFYFLHARLWFLIALNRIAVDFPKDVVQFEKLLLEIVLNDKFPHVLMRHFASKTIITLIEKGKHQLSSDIESKIRSVNISPFPKLRKKLKYGMHDSIYSGRPKGAPQPKLKFFLDMDFEKYEVSSLSNVFGKPEWEVKDLIAEIVHSYDNKITSMYDHGGREPGHRSRSMGMSSKYHGYGEYLGWHAALIVAGDLLQKFPVTDDSYNEEPWEEWLERFLLTRQDDLWLSDGLNLVPFQARINLLEKGVNGLDLTGSKTKILNLLGLESKSQENIIVDGTWKSPDNVRVRVTSALVDVQKTNDLVNQLIRTDPFAVFLPVYDQNEDYPEYLRNDDKKDYTAWITNPSRESGIDIDDPLGTIYSVMRPRFSEDILKSFSIKSSDKYNRSWETPNHKQIAYADAWGIGNENNDENVYSGTSLTCSVNFLKELLSKKNKDLLILVSLEIYREKSYDKPSTFSHTIAVIKLSKSLKIKFFKGVVNQIYKNMF